MRPHLLILLIALLTGCATILNGGSNGMEIGSDPSEATVFVNGNQRGTTPFSYSYDPADGTEVMFELRKNGYKPTTFSMRPKMDNGVLFADAMLLGIPYIADRMSPALYEMRVGSYRANLYKEVDNDLQRFLIPVASVVLAMGDRPDPGTLKSAPIKVGKDGLFQDLSYVDGLSNGMLGGLRDSWMDARTVRTGTTKGDEMVQRAKLILVPEVERIHATLTGERRKVFGPIELTMRWKFMAHSTSDSVLFERRTTTTYDVPGDQADQALSDALRHAARRLLEDPELPSAVATAYGAGLALSKGSTIELRTPLPIPFDGRKDMLAALVKAVVTIQTERGHGSGFLIANDGYLLTNHHVVEKESMVKVKFEQGFTLDAQVVKTNPDFDLALLKVQASDLPALSIGNDAGLMLGEEIFAIGTPMETSLGQSVSRGILSGRRDLEGRNYLQTDVSINPGNSGGPLIDETGKVVGVATMKISGKGLEGLGFGVPISVALQELNIVLAP
ncbi:MAG: trypsin-like peptidase domain-containing protein [Flavobacteriales bacterium]|nr:trypsin-like peptidase domain-containing protein [Flavobacteriales bacterium]